MLIIKSRARAVLAPGSTPAWGSGATATCSSLLGGTELMHPPDRTEQAIVRGRSVDSCKQGRYFNNSHSLGVVIPARVRRYMVRKKLGRGRKNRCRFCTK